MTPEFKKNLDDLLIQQPDAEMLVFIASSKGLVILNSAGNDIFALGTLKAGTLLIEEGMKKKFAVTADANDLMATLAHDLTGGGRPN